MLDVLTLTFAGALVSLATGLFLVGIWWHERTAPAIFWWGLANTVGAIGIACVAFDGKLLPEISKVAGPLLLQASAALTFAAAMIFNRSRFVLTPIAIGLGLLAVLFVAGFVTGEAQLFASIRMMVSAGFLVLAALEFWGGRDEELRGRRPMIVLLSLQAVAIALAAVDLATAARFQMRPDLGIFGVIHFVAIVYFIGSTTSLVSMLKERSEAAFRAAALVDPLTGLSNRRAFLDHAERIFAALAREMKPVSVLAFDLDRFKRVNDVFGHAAGDRILTIFAQVTSRHLRPNDIVGRLGGEEFVAVLSGCDQEVAFAIAGRIRTAFQEAGEFLDGQKISATVSVGMITVTNGTLAAALEQADDALYRAKELGRNRVVIAEAGVPGPSHPKLIRIA